MEFKGRDSFYTMRRNKFLFGTSSPFCTNYIDELSRPRALRDRREMGEIDAKALWEINIVSVRQPRKAPKTQLEIKHMVKAKLRPIVETAMKIWG